MVSGSRGRPRSWCPLTPEKLSKSRCDEFVKVFCLCAAFDLASFQGFGSPLTLTSVLDPRESQDRVWMLHDGCEAGEGGVREV